ncbi:MAG: ribonuclease Z [Anaerolineales bacterium]|nr:ribonuclease Z [Anaerolineales bacterium]
MVRLLVLGSSSAVTAENRRPTQLACLGAEHGLLIDCGASPCGRLEDLGADAGRIDDVFITHFHPDHAAGLPAFLMESVLRGRRAPLRIHAGAQTVRKLRRLTAMFGWGRMPERFPLRYHSVPRGRRAAVLENGDFRVFAAPVRHVVPTLAVRVELIRARSSFVYSADTEPCAALVELARGADLLIHEATGEGTGHSSAAQAAAAARDARAGKLLLIHTDPRADGGALLAEANRIFDGETALAADKMEIDW